jgi:hypothetical protein
LGSDENHKDVADVAIRKYFSTYEVSCIFGLFFSLFGEFQVPEVSEGFEDVIDVEFIPEFGSEKERSVYSQFLLEK